MDRYEQKDLENLQQDLERRQIRPRGPVRAREVLNQLLARRGYTQRRAGQDRERLWKEAVGEPLASHSRAVKLSRGVLIVMVRNSAIHQELAFMQAELLRKLSAANPDMKLKSLRFQVGAID
ncbi:MAG: DUF721 domain-containing protein [Planctomycetales bacterium]|nr:DUF721 domain-containing protein [Planctomycetales bacterium]